MSAFSVLLNLFTLFVIAIVLYTGYNMYRRRPDRNATATEVFNNVLADPATATHAYFTEPPLGPIGDFTDYDWDRVKSSSVEE
jgi:hypothetical protein